MSNEDVDTSDPVTLYREAEEAVFSLISGPPSPPPGTTREEIRRRATERLERLRAFLAYIGNPHLNYRTIHVAGTSGKGSTSTYIASILQEAGFRTGLHVSPYIQVATEKLVLNGQLISAEDYHRLVNELMEHSKAWEALGNEPLTYGEFWVAMTFVYFAQEQVDYAVIEVGAGGRYDLTNVIEPEVAAITSIGMDHVVTLGPTLADIAWHKAGIIKAGGAAVTTVTEPETLAVIEQEASAAGVDLVVIREGVDYSDVDSGWTGTTFRDAKSEQMFHVKLSGDFQAANGALAVAVTRAIPGQSISDDAIARGLLHARFPGRMELVQHEPAVLLDGAHNPQKMEGLVKNLGPMLEGRRAIGVFGVLDSKSHIEMLEILSARVDRLIITMPYVYAKPAATLEELASEAAAHFRYVESEPEPLRAIERAIDLAGADDVVIVTGSLYLVGNVRGYWYPEDEILSRGTMWPGR